MTSPARIAANTVRVSGESIPMMPVKQDIPKNRVFNYVQALKDIQIPIPVTASQIILPNAAETSVPMIAAKNFPRNQLPKKSAGVLDSG